MLENSFGMWQEVSTSYLNFVTSATRQIMDQSLAVQKEMVAISETGLKQSVELLATEQAMVLEAAEARIGRQPEGRTETTKSGCGCGKSNAASGTEGVS